MKLAGGLGTAFSHFPTANLALDCELLVWSGKPQFRRHRAARGQNRLAKRRFSSGYTSAQKSTLLYHIAIFIVTQATWNSGEASRNQLFRYERALEELRDMYMLGRVEAMRHGLNECDILLCGRNQYYWNTDGKKPKFRPIFNFDYIFADVNTASTYFFLVGRGTQYHPLAYARFLRIPSRFRLPTSEEKAEHEETLAAMPSWPADGSIRAEGTVVLIKIGPEIDEGEP